MEIPLQTKVFKIINRVVVMFVKTVINFCLKICYLKKKKTNFQKNQNAVMFTLIASKAGCFLMIISPLMKYYLDQKLT